LAEHIVFLCTGNAARSVMATIMFRARTDRHVVSGSGTHALPGHPMSVRTRTALAQLGLADPTHRSAQFDETDVRRASLIVAMAPEHVQWVRRVHPEAADRTVTLKRVVRTLTAVAPSQADAALRDRVRALGLAGLEIEEWEEVVDPAGGEQPEFDACAREIDALVDQLIALL
jgi:protein-tyrosine-phosphatase